MLTQKDIKKIKSFWISKQNCLSQCIKTVLQYLNYLTNPENSIVVFSLTWLPFGQSYCITFTLSINFPMITRWVNCQHLQNQQKYKTCVINDPLGLTHSPTSIDHYFHSKFVFVLRYFKIGNLCENNGHYRPGLWVGRVDQ